MNTYLIPICDNEDIYIMTINARDMESAEEKLMQELCDTYSDLDESILDYQDFLDDAAEKGIIIGDFYDKETF